MSQRNSYRLKQGDKDFAAAWEEAIETAIDRLEEEAWRRAIEGDEEYVVSGGHLVLGPDETPLKKNRKSDKILLTLLRANRRKYRLAYQVEHSGTLDVGAEALESAKVRLAQILKIPVGS